jgi:Tol biopolymer transport system component
MRLIPVVLGILLAFQTAAQTIEVKPFAPELFNENISAGVCGFSADGKTMYYVQEDTVQNKLFLYQASYKKGKWGNPELLPFSGQYNDYGGRLSENGDAFYFTSDRPHGSMRAKDDWNIWRVQRTQNGWTDPIPLIELNSKGNECCPLPYGSDQLMFSGDRGREEFWHIKTLTHGDELSQQNLNGMNSMQWPSSFADKKTLLLNSMRKDQNFGMDDIYISHLSDDGTWSAPTNLGTPVNSAVYEDGAILSPDGKWLIFCRHTTHNTPSRVLYVSWREVKRRLEKQK